MRRTGASIATAALLLGGAGVALATGAPAKADRAEAARTEAGAAAQARPPTRLWYRIRADVTADYRLDAYGNHRDRSAKWRMKSTGAVIVYRQCSVRGGLRGRDLETALGLTRSQTCADVRRRLRGPRWRSVRQRLVDDVRFTAVTTGSLQSYRRFEPYGPEQVGAVTCPAADQFTLTLLTPAPIRGRLATSSLYTKGVSPSLRGASRPVDGLFVTTPYACVDPATGATIRSREGRVVQGDSAPGLSARVDLGEAFGAPVARIPAGSEAAKGPLRLEPVRGRNLGRMFGRSFTLSGTQTGTYRYARGSGTERRTVRYTLRFTLCPRGGRRARGC